MLNRQFTVDNVTLTSTGTSVSSYLPYDQTTRKLPTQVVVKATGQGAYVRLSDDQSAATDADVLVQAGDHVVLSVNGRHWVSVLSVVSSSTVNVGALSTGVWGDAATLSLPFTTGALDSRITLTRALNTATYFDANGTLQTAAANTPRFDYDPVTRAARGLLIEEQRTNSIRNNTMVGASAGVAPTNWAAWNVTTNGVTIATSAAGTENGIAYIDIAVSGTSTLTGTAQTPSFETSLQIAATVSQVWTESVYLTLVSGLIGDATFNIRMTETDAVGATLTTGDSAAVVPAANNLLSARYVFTRTLTNASTAFVIPRFRFAFVNGTTYNFTLRIGLPQLEQGAFATSVIPTSTVAVTRSADNASITTLTPWFNATEGALVGEASISYGVSTNIDAIASLDDNTVNNRMQLRRNATQIPSGIVMAAGTATFNSGAAGASTVAANTVFKIGLAYATNNTVMGDRGLVSAVDTTVTLPTVTQLQIGNGTALQYLNGHIRRITYYPRRLANTELQAITL